VAGKPARRGVVGGVLVLALVYCAVGYVTGAVPFPVQQRGELTAGDLCGSICDGERAAEELRTTLPARREYSSSETNPPRSRDDISWQASCLLSGDGDLLLYASAELGWDASARTWLDDPTRNYVDDEGKGTPFRAGSAAVVMAHTAQILVPCVPRQGTTPYHLVIEVHANKPLEGSAKENQHALAAVAVGTARSAHERAECPLRSTIPPSVSGLE